MQCVYAYTKLPSCFSKWLHYFMFSLNCFPIIIFHVTSVIHLFVFYFFYWRIGTNNLDVERQMTEVFKLECLNLGLFWKNGIMVTHWGLPECISMWWPNMPAERDSCYKQLFISNGSLKKLIPVKSWHSKRFLTSCHFCLLPSPWTHLSYKISGQFKLTHIQSSFNK